MVHTDHEKYTYNTNDQGFERCNLPRTLQNGNGLAERIPAKVQAWKEQGSDTRHRGSPARKGRLFWTHRTQDPD